MSKLIKIFLMIIFALAVSCSNEGTTGGGTDGGGDDYTYDNNEYGQFLPPESSYTGKNYGVSSSETTIQVVKNSDGTCNLKGKVTLNEFDSSTKKYKELDINVKILEWSRSKGETDNATSRSVDKTTLPSGITYFSARHYFRASYTSGSTKYPNTYYLTIDLSGVDYPYTFEGKVEKK
ncbi:hypothetical protein [Brachyspira aalborgi]|uniref:Lipoprotein n=1 Tax=Brachyspira aalborgi TaxID=29522 RepID=A0A5C8EJA8_9SPIR|nr:hypothetical protein [Brachyspira aalborgi]TXJ37041.1 hypothetical protein EPJ78_06845 [Brachyspira aalborgi]